LNLLILGSEGFIGSNCVTYFFNSGYTVYGADLFERPNSDYHYTKVSRLSPELEELFGEISFDFIINASGSGNVPYSVTHPLIDFEANCLDVARVLDVIRRLQPSCRYIHLSSAAVYGNPVSLPVKESDNSLPMSPYGWHKYISELQCKEYYSVYNVHTVIIRPFSVYGPGLKKQLYWDIYHRLKTDSQLLQLFGTGAESRDFIFIEDLILAIETVMKNGSFNAEIYNAATGIETTIADAVNIFLSSLGLSPAIQFNGSVRSGDPLNWRGDISKLQLLGFNPKFDLKTGMAKLAGWIKAF
jgi:nucleoside-diphosphate-sugar epimerase